MLVRERCSIPGSEDSLFRVEFFNKLLFDKGDKEGNHQAKAQK